MPDPDRWIARQRDLVLYLAATCVTSIIQFGQGVAVGWFIYEKTDSELALGLVGLVQFLPVLAFFLPAGHIADSFDRRRVVMLSLAITASASALLAVIATADLPVPVTYVALALSGCAQILNRPARDALLPNLVPAGNLARALALNASLFQIASVGAPALAGALLAAFGSAFPVHAVNVGLAVIAFGLTMAIRARQEVGARRAVTLNELLAGFVFVWEQRPVLAVMSVDLFAVLFGGAVALLPVFAKDVLHVGPAGLGLLNAAPAAGAVLVALGVARFGVRVDGKVFLGAVAGFGAAMIVFGLSTNFWLSLGALIAAGAFDSVGVVIRLTVVQSLTPDHLRGRVSAINRVFISSSNELGAFESGLLAALIGAIPTVVVGGFVTLAIVALSPRVFPQLRSLRQAIAAH